MKLVSEELEEGIIEQFFSLAGFIYDGRRYNLNDENITAIYLQHLWEHLDA